MCDVNIATGELERSATDLFLPGYIPIEFSRLYKSSDSHAGYLGRGWHHSYNARLSIIDGSLHYHDGFGGCSKFDDHPSEPGNLLDSSGELTLSEERGNWIVTDGEHLRHVFSPLHGSFAESRPSQILDSHGNAINFHYDSRPATFAVADNLGRLVSFEGGLDGLLRRVRAESRGESSTLETYFDYDRAGHLILVQDPAGRRTSYEYDGDLLVREVRSDNHEIYWSYDQSGRCIETWRSDGQLYRQLDFDDIGKRVRLTNSRGYVYIYELDGEGGIVKEVDPLDGITETFVDNRGETILSARNGQSNGHSATFNEATNRMEVSEPFGKLVYQFDDRDRLISISSDTGGVWKYEYDSLGDTVLDERPCGSRFQATYSQQGWVRNVTANSGYYIEQTRSEDRRQIATTDNYGTLCLMDLDGFGAVKRVTDSAHPDVYLEYDKVGRLVSIHSSGLHWQASYDTNDNVQEIITASGQRWSYKYGPTGLLEHVVEPGGGRTEFRYDSEQLLVYIRKPNGEEVKIDYDPLDRPTAVHFPDGSVESYGYDSGSDIASVSVNGKWRRRFTYENGNVTGILYSDGSRREFQYIAGMPAIGSYMGHTVQRVFDERSRMLEEKSGPSHLVLAYDSANNLTRISAEGRTIDLDYDGRKRVSRIDDAMCGVHRFTYQAGSELSQWKIDGGCTIDFLMDDRTGMLAGFRVTAPDGSLVAEHSNIYSEDGKVLSDSFRSKDGERVVSYTYDEAGRPTTVTSAGEMAFQFDANNNLVFSTELGNCSYAPGDRLTASDLLSYDYDEFGRVIRKRDQAATWTYEYNSASELVLVSSDKGEHVQFEYDAFGRLRSRVVRSVRTAYQWLDNSILSEESDQHFRHYLFLPTSFFCIAIHDSEFGKAFLCPDRTGAPVCMIGFDGVLLWQRAFRLFGEQPATSSVACPIEFLGQYREPHSALNYNYARFYDPATGRYLTPDPIGFEAGTNFYAYAQDPLTGCDPYGLVPIDLKAPPLWCKWNRQQRQEYRDKVNRYNEEIQNQEKQPGQGILVSKCARSGKKASQQWASSKCCKQKPPKKKKPKNGKGAWPDCVKDIDHIIDCQLGGAQDCPDVCKNLTPVNKSVNASFGPTMEAKLAGMQGQFLTSVTFKPQRCKKSTPRTPSCA